MHGLAPGGCGHPGSWYGSQRTLVSAIQSYGARLGVGHARPSLAAELHRRASRACLDEAPQLARRPCAAGVVSTPVDTSTPHGRTRRIASPTFSGVSPPASRRRTPGGAPSASASRTPCPSRDRASRRGRCRPGRCRPRRARGRRPRTPGSRTAPARGSSAPRTAARGRAAARRRRPSVLTISTTRSGRSSRNTPTVITLARQAADDVARPSPGRPGAAARREHETRARRRRGRRRGGRPPRW